MNSDDRIRRAFDDLQRRSESVDPRFSRQRLPAPRPRRPWVAALAGAAAVVTVIGVVAVSGILSGPETDDAVIATTVPDVTTLLTTTTSDPAVTTTITVPVDTSAYPTHRVVGVADDDVLNVRSEPGASADLVAVLPPRYAGIRAIDNVATVEDGGEWRQIELLDPTRVIDGGELDGQPLIGWVNTAFIEAYDPSQPDVSPCEHDLGHMPEPTGEAPDHVYSIRQFGLGGCIRTVVTFGQDFDTGYWPIDGITTDMRPAGTPGLVRHQVNGTTVFVLEGVPYAWDPQSGTHESSVALVGRWTDGSLAIFVTVPGTTSVRISATGNLVIDVTPFGTAPVAGNGFHLLGSPVVGPGGTLEVWGLARPFEANIGTVILDHTGSPPEGVVGPPYVMTNDWTDAWGLFQYRAVGLEPGVHLLTLVQEGGDRAIELAVDFTVPDRDAAATIHPDDISLTDRLQAFARDRGVSAADVPFAAGVIVSLGDEHSFAVDPARRIWVIDAEEFNGYAGPFDVLAPLRGSEPIITTVGPQPRCAAPPLDVPAEWESTRRLSISPAGISSCLEWYALDVFLGPDGSIERVMLDLWEP